MTCPRPWLALFLTVVSAVRLASEPCAGDELRLAAGLDTIQPEEIRSDLFFFASDEMRGRDTPSPEQRVAARFLRARLERLGFTPGGSQGFFFEYPLRSRAIDPERSTLTVESAAATLTWRYGTDYFVTSSQDLVALDTRAEVVFCGGGDRKDLEGPAIKGRWVLCVAGDVPVRRRQRYAETAGAAGVILIPDPAGTDDPARAECQRTTDNALRGIVGLGGESGEERKALPQVFLTLAAGRDLLAALGAKGLPAKGTVLTGNLHEVRAGAGVIQAENVCALWPGSDPVLGKEVLIVSAHYDHVGVTGGAIYNGADDNGSGSMGLLALAEALQVYGPMRRTVLLTWVSGEEKGLWGSDAWTRHPTLPAGYKAVCDVNIDMIGRNAPDKLLITPTQRLKEYNGLTRLAEALGAQEGFPKLGSADEYWQRSDHMNFAENMKIPVAFLFSDVHEDYHQPSDDPEKIDYDKIRRVTRLVLRMLDALQADHLEL